MATRLVLGGRGYRASACAACYGSGAARPRQGAFAMRQRATAAQLGLGGRLPCVGVCLLGAAATRVLTAAIVLPGGGASAAGVVSLWRRAGG